MKIKDHRVLVTGGAGFIGSHLVDCLLVANNEVIVVDDFSSGSYENLSQHAHNPRLHLEKADVLDEPAMLSIHRGVELVFHLAARNIRLSLRQPTQVHEVNATGTLNVMKASAAARVKRFLYCSSSEVNGSADVVPMVEDYHFRPETIYGASKLAGEYYTQVFDRSGWLNTVIARPHNNYGPREHYEGVKGEVIPRFILRALAGLPPVVYGDGTQTRDFTYVTETAEFLVNLMESEAAVGQTFNICRGQEVSILGIAHLIVELTRLGRPPEHRPARPHDVMRLFGDPTRLRQTLGAAPRIGIRDGLIRTIEWFRNHVSITPEVLASMQVENWGAVQAEPWLANLGAESAIKRAD